VKSPKANLPCEADLAATRSTFGALKGILDERQMKKIYEARGSNRPPVKLQGSPPLSGAHRPHGR
jgi:hypothetical protein